MPPICRCWASVGPRIFGTRVLADFGHLPVERDRGIAVGRQERQDPRYCHGTAYHQAEVTPRFSLDGLGHVSARNSILTSSAGSHSRMVMGLGGDTANPVGRRAFFGRVRAVVHSSGTPALRRPARNVFSLKVRIFRATPACSPQPPWKRAMLDKRPPLNRRALANSETARSLLPFRA
jgi:hypothetical protein